MSKIELIPTPFLDITNWLSTIVAPTLGLPETLFPTLIKVLVPNPVQVIPSLE
jgi:hypothetical protein